MGMASRTQLVANACGNNGDDGRGSLQVMLLLVGMGRFGRR